jgi:hypothetical protein
LQIRFIGIEPVAAEGLKRTRLLKGDNIVRNEKLSADRLVAENSEFNNDRKRI